VCGRPERSPDPQAGEQWQHHRSIAGLARGEQDDQQAATAVDRGVDLRAQPAARPAESVIARFVPAAARIVVIRPSLCVLVEPRTILPNALTTHLSHGAWSLFRRSVQLGDATPSAGPRIADLQQYFDTH
jgi:hypothetical protein